jgi:guanylate kinase
MISQRRLGLVFVLVGPPGAGKNVLMNNVLKRRPDLKQLPTATTRPMRPTEQQGREHLFVSHEEFQRLEKTKSLLESQEIHGEWYGIPKSTVTTAVQDGHDIIADIDVLGAMELRAIYPDNAVLIFIQPSSIDDLKMRMHERGESDAEIEKRMRRVTMEMQYAPLCDYLITNETGKIDQSSETLHAVVVAERSHRALLNLRTDRHLPRHAFTYCMQVIPILGEQVLCRGSEPHFPTALLAHGEYPHETALRTLNMELGLEASLENLYPYSTTAEYVSEAGFVAPIMVTDNEKVNHHEITFVYFYSLPSRINPPQEWSYTAFDQAQLPDGAEKLIRSTLSGVSHEQEIVS